MKSEVVESIKRLNRVMKRQTVNINNNASANAYGNGRILRIIMENEGIIVKDLAKLLDIRPPSLTEKLVKLEANGNVLRVRDNRDKRILHVCITEKGKEAVSLSAEKKGVADREVSDCLSAAEKALFCDLCDRMSDNMEAIVEEEKAAQDMLIMAKVKGRNK